MLPSTSVRDISIGRRKGQITGKIKQLHMVNSMNIQTNSRYVMNKIKCIISSNFNKTNKCTTHLTIIINTTNLNAKQIIHWWKLWSATRPICLRKMIHDLQQTLLFANKFVMCNIVCIWKKQWRIEKTRHEPFIFLDSLKNPYHLILIYKE